MKLLKLSATLALALTAGHACAAVTLDSHGLGQGLLYPYFSANNGQTTLLSVQNTTAQGKALKVRVLESHGGYETLVFNLYLPPFGNWSSALTLANDAPNTAATLLPGTPAVGCTVPALPPQGVALQPYAFEGDDGPQGLERTRAGSVEIVEMGTLDAALTALVKAGPTSDCAALAARTQAGGIWLNDEANGIEAPTGKLRGAATIVNVAAGTSFAYSAPAFNGLATQQRHNPTDVSQVGTLFVPSEPRLIDVQTGENADIEAVVTGSDGAPVTLQYPADEGFNAISAVLATTQGFTWFNVDPALRTRTEWIVSFPTRRAHLDAAPSVVPLPEELLAPPFAAACDAVPFVAWNTQGTKADTASSLQLCGAADVILFTGGDTQADPIVAMNGDTEMTVAATQGTARLDFRKFGDAVRAFNPDKNGKCVLGLPAVVMAVQGYDNDNAQAGRIATFPVTNVASGPVEVVDCDTLD